MAGIIGDEMLSKARTKPLCGLCPCLFALQSPSPIRDAVMLAEKRKTTMPREIDSRIADHLVSTAISSLDSPRGSKVVCTKRALDAALRAAVREAHEIGFLAGQQERYANHTRPGSPARPAWMDIPLDHWKEHGIRLKPVVLQSLIAAGYRRLGDLRWMPERQLIGLHYVGIKTARALRAVVQRFEAAEPSSEGAGRPAHSIDGPASL